MAGSIRLGSVVSDSAAGEREVQQCHAVAIGPLLRAFVGLSGGLTWTVGRAIHSRISVVAVHCGSIKG